ncbi:glucose sorbosone dehydrogenase [Ectocarpus siliculosus]|uniref:Glucose sorbosone dehydrogenase n=1 Tax=Ectocarpus siliculosus TaxID=2880 RepID=D7G961_ECTSI|nr:glucose sorbosone dehydrogenase [Ectocarpus siliculosus]|eukprot:CBJ28225.1 glucose sorbosone dehydrogenase [Ectocarpus siliculosus]
MMRAFACLAALVGIKVVTSHPLCFFDDRPTDYNEVLTFCDTSIAAYGACCTDDEEVQVMKDFSGVTPEGVELTGDCSNLYKEVVCGRCHSFSAHLYENLAPELGLLDGMTMKSDFCNELLTACGGQINFPTYDNNTVDYCTKHTGGGDDFFWSYPYEEAISDPRFLNEVFPDLGDNQQPDDTVSMRQTPDGSQWWLLGISGQIYAGLLDLAFGPMFGDDSYPQYFYVSYTVLLDDGENQRNRLARFTYVPGDPVATRATEEVLLTTVPKYNSVHSAGWLGFKPSVYGSAEICAIGLRNPWRCSFDRLNDDLYCGDVGQISVEEINFIECGNNYGWSRFEGSRCQEAVQDNEFNPPCDGVDRSDFTYPLFEYCHPDFDSTDADEQEFTGGADTCGNRFVVGNCVIGGYVYRGNFFSDLLDGAYIFGDSTMRNIYFLKEEEDGWAVGTIVSDASVQIISFAEDVNGEIVLLDYNHDIYHMPCGDLCVTTCLDQAEDQPAYESLGCFADDVNDRALPTEADNCGVGETAMSPAICASYCETLGSTFFGVQYSFQAYPDEFCGGFSTMEVFTIEDPLPTEAPAPTPLMNHSTTAPGATPSPTTTTVGPVLVGPSTAPTTPAPLDAGVAGYLGCFADAEAPRVFPETGMTGSNTMTTATCAGLCSDYAYYATQYGREVYSTSSDPTETPAPVADNAYLGCFADSTTDRVLSVVIDSGSMTTAICADTCAEYAYYGTQYGREIYSTGLVVETPSPVPDVETLSPVPDVETPSPVPDVETLSPVPDVETPSPVPDVETPSPVAPTEPGYLGCFADSTTDRVFSVVTGSGSMTTAICADTCAEYAYYGTQYGREIYSTGLVVETPSPVPDVETPSPVPDVETASPVVTTEPGYLGCFGDSQTGRVFSVVTGSGSMTTAICAGTCADYAYYGTQFGREVYGTA